MKSRKEIKAIAKEGFSKMYWSAVGTNLIYGIIAIPTLFFGAVISGFNLYCLKAYRGEKDSMKFDFTGRKVGGYLWMSLFNFLWLLLFVIPGIIKSYSYSMTTYILGDCPNVKATDAVKLSKRMMKGHKWQLFVMQLSFIGWGILNAITIGLVGLFYSAPYANIAYAGFYDEVKNEAISTGAVTQEQYDGIVAA